MLEEELRSHSIFLWCQTFTPGGFVRSLSDDGAAVIPVAVESYTDVRMLLHMARRPVHYCCVPPQGEVHPKALTPNNSE